MMLDFPDLSRFPDFAYDTETTGLDTNNDDIFGFSLSTPDGKDYYYDIRETPEAMQYLNNACRDFEGEYYVFNQSFDQRMTDRTNVKMPWDMAVDARIQASLINEHESAYTLDYLSRKYTDSYKKGDELYGELAKLFGGRATKNVQMSRISQAPSRIVAPYAKGDTRSTYDLAKFQAKEIKRQGLEKIVEFERKVTPVIIAAEKRGVRVDVQRAEQAVGELSEIIKRKQKELNDIAGFQCNPQPSKDIIKLFNPKWREGRWWAIDGTPLEETEAGNASLGAEALRKMSHPAAATILELRSLLKTRDTFIVGHVLESAHNGRVYPTINQVKGDDGGTSTGRLSYVAPALQQIPDRNKEVAKIVKPIFLPEEGHSWVDMDEASFEVRIFAHLVGTPDITQAYMDDPETDFHQFVAELTGLPRNATYVGEPNAKQLNLSMIFNQGNGTTAEKMNMPWEWQSFIPWDSADGKEIVYKKAGHEAMMVIEKYHKRLPGVKRLADGCKATAEKRGYLFTRYGRYLRFPRGYKSYKASGILIQSTAADENKMNWLLADEALKSLGNGARMLLNTHDSYSFSIPIGEEERTARRIKEALEEDRGLRVPLVLEIQNPGKNWWDSKSSKRWM